VIVLIPAYEPGSALIELVRSLRGTAQDIDVVVIDDGSGSQFQAIFAAVADLGCDILTYAANRGKGHALKSGFRYIERRYPGRDVVCADCDGQHTVVDILRVAGQLHRSRSAMVLGVRTFAGNVPLRSRFGNSVSRVLFRVATGRWLQDTQTGLRGYPAPMLSWLQSVHGDRYDYELNLLMRAADAGMDIETVEISTVYLNSNESSHFRPVVDSVRIYAPLLRFALSSLTAFVIDTVALLTLFAATGSLVVSIVGARVLSSSVNFAINRRAVFEHGRDKPTVTAAVQYFALVVGLLGLNYASLLSLQTLGMPLLPAKLVTELLLFAVSWAVQRRFVFARRIRRREPLTPVPDTKRVSTIGGSQILRDGGSTYAGR
jgi:putative flippase GtrA